MLISFLILSASSSSTNSETKGAISELSNDSFLDLFTSDSDFETADEGLPAVNLNGAISSSSARLKPSNEQENNHTACQSKQNQANTAAAKPNPRSKLKLKNQKKSSSAAAPTTRDDVFESTASSDEDLLITFLEKDAPRRRTTESHSTPVQNNTRRAAPTSLQLFRDDDDDITLLDVESDRNYRRPNRLFPSLTTGYFFCYFHIFRLPS